ncbi:MULTISPECIES: glycosyl hydrolase family 95 catalytic domain-containing protein [Bacteria]|uniref:glycosyl hydrolase family 95 catalytic domain-containing protein n=1 Tax=Bacteria TaxID=2 RepID=UPI003C7EBB75
MDTTLNPTVLRFERAGASWLAGIPVGNGAAGAMIHGAPWDQVIALNDETFWSPGPVARDFAAAEGALASVRERLAEGDVLGAQEAASLLLGVPERGAAFQPVGNVRLRSDGAADGSSRALDLRTGIASFEWTRDQGGASTRSVVASRHPSGLVVRQRSALPEHTVIGFESPFLDRLDVGTGGWIATGQWREVPRSRQSVADSYRLEGYDGRRLRFAVGMTVLLGERDELDRAVSVRGAEWAVGIAVATDFDGSDPEETVSRRLQEMRAHPSMALADTAAEEHRAVFDRSSIALRPRGRVVDAVLKSEPTDLRVHGLRAGGVDDDLVRLMADHGRYLLIASTVGGLFPPTLQGVWNEDTEPAWSSNWTTNINLQMSLWAAGPLNVPEALDGLMRLLEHLAQAGRRTAQLLYGAGGSAWVVHHNTDIWFNTAPTTMFEVGLFPAAGLWLTVQAYQLASRYPLRADRDGLFALLRGCGDLLDTWLVPGSDGMLRPSPSSTPENAYLLPGVERPRRRAVDPDHRRHGWIGTASTIDLSLARATYDALLDLAGQRGEGDGPEAVRWRSQRDRLAPVEIVDGRIAEWQAPREPLELGHRHLSALYSLYPGDGEWGERPEVVEAAARTLADQVCHVEYESVGFGGWSRVWAAALWARLGEGDRALSSLESVIGTGIAPESLLHVFPAFDHAPAPEAVFQIEANLGIAAVLAEMVVQSRPGHVMVLPALPARWASGEARGIRCHGGLEVDVAWQDGTLRSVRVSAEQATCVALHLPPEAEDVSLDLDGGGFWSWTAEQGR